MRKIWMRVGVTIDFPEEVIERILSDDGTMSDFALAIRHAFQDGRFALDGEAYIPALMVAYYNEEYGTDHCVDEYETNL